LYLLAYAKVPVSSLSNGNGVLYTIDRRIVVYIVQFLSKKMSYTDNGMAYLMSCKYTTVVLFTFPSGLFMKGRKLIQFFKLHILDI